VIILLRYYCSAGTPRSWYAGSATRVAFPAVYTHRLVRLVVCSRLLITALFVYVRTVRSVTHTAVFFVHCCYLRGTYWLAPAFPLYYHLRRTTHFAGLLLCFRTTAILPVNDYTAVARAGWFHWIVVLMHHRFALVGAVQLFLGSFSSFALVHRFIVAHFGFTALVTLVVACALRRSRSYFQSFLIPLVVSFVCSLLIATSPL